MKTLPFVLMLAVLAMPCTTFAQQDKAQAPAVSEGTKMRSSPEHPRSGERMKKHEAKMSRMKEMDARLDEKVAAMDAAKGDEKVEAMAAVIKEMVSQRKSMREHMKSRQEMRKGKQGHMKRGTRGEPGKRETM